MTERFRLIKELNKIGFDDSINCCVDVGTVADFILADRNRIATPLLDYHKELDDVCKAYFRDTSEYGPDERISSLFIALEKTLDNAGLTPKS